ncbi:MAG: hypothetical protein HC892_08410 [Saprospiraceae bacterium]|nr:hypothetical protein [Saprospiraceae bacterium]
MNKALLTLLALVSLIYLCRGQIYFNDSHKGSRLSILDLTCDFNYLTNKPQYIADGFDRITFGDIALHPNGKMYGSESVRNPAFHIIHEFNMKDKTIKDTLEVNGELLPSTSLCISEEGIFYMGYTSIQSYNPTTKILTNHGQLPNGATLQGDLFFGRGNCLDLRLIFLDPKNLSCTKSIWIILLKVKQLPIFPTFQKIMMDLEVRP